MSFNSSNAHFLNVHTFEVKLVQSVVILNTFKKLDVLLRELPFSLMLFKFLPFLSQLSDKFTHKLS